MSVLKRGNGEGWVRDNVSHFQHSWAQEGLNIGRKTPFGRVLVGRARSDGEGRKLRAHISGVAYSGALILMPSFRRLQKSSSICTPGYGDPPAGDSGGKHRACHGLGVQKTTGE